MVFDLRGYFKSLYLVITKLPITPARLGRLTLFVLIYPIFWLVFYLTRWMDDILFRGYRKQTIKTPIFIIANPRSGTTFLHRLMCLDSQFTYFKTYQIAFPSMTMNFFFRALGWIDKRSGHFGAKLIKRWDTKFFGFWEGIHSTGLTRAEEDEGVFCYTGYTPLAFLFFPFFKELKYLVFSDELPEKTQQRLMSFYVGCIKRHLSVNGKDKILLSKNVLFPGRMKALLKTFPDMKVIYLVRHPYEAVPSFMSLLLECWKIHSPEVLERPDEIRSFSEIPIAYYRYMLEIRNFFPKHALITIRYEDLIQNPYEILGHIYESLGLKFSDEFRQMLLKELERHKHYQSTHQYTLESFGLSKTSVYEPLKEMFDVYGFEK